MWIFQEGSLKEQQCKKAFHSLEDTDILPVMGVTGLSPFNLFGQIAFQNAPTEYFCFLRPECRVAEELVGPVIFHHRGSRLWLTKNRMLSAS